MRSTAWSQLPPLALGWCVMVWALCTQSAAAVSCAGCVDLDELNFERTVVRFPYALVKFDIAFPYGDKHEAYAQFSRAAHKASDELLVATVGIKDYGELENKALGERYNVDEKNFPAIYLFRGRLDDYVQWPAHLDVTLDNLKQFVSEQTPLYIGRDGCLKEFNELAKNYAQLPASKQQQLLARAEQMAEQLEPESEQARSGQWYVLFMRKINAQGAEYVELETKRLQRLRAGKVSAPKKQELRLKLNVLGAFRVTGKLVKDTAETTETTENEEL